jgi:hypothetical protein
MWAAVCVPWLALIIGVSAWGYTQYADLNQPEPAGTSLSPPDEAPEPVQVAIQKPATDAELELMEMAGGQEISAALMNGGAEIPQPPNTWSNEYAPDYPIMLTSLHSQWDKGSMSYFPSPDEFERLWDKLVHRYPNNTERQLYEAVLTVYGVKQYYPGVTIKQALEELVDYVPRGSGGTIRSAAKEIFQNVEDGFWERVRQSEEARAKEMVEIRKQEQAMMGARQKAEEARLQAYKDAEERRWKSFERNRAYNILYNTFH